MPAMNKITKKSAAVAAGVLVAFGGGAYAIGATSGSAKETPLTGKLTDKIRDAALAKVPGGSLVGVESEPGGAYEATVRRTNGSYVDVEMNSSLKVTGTHAGGRFGGRDHVGPGHGMDPAALAKALGVSPAKLQNALQTLRPQRDHHAAVAAKIATALGVKTSVVQSALEGRRGFGHRGPGGGDDLVAALAKKTGKSQAAVRRALETARPDRGQRFDDFAAKLAKELGLSTAKVQKALESQRPPGRPGFRGPGGPDGPPPGAPAPYGP
jgi:hypothetical protein